MSKPLPPPPGMQSKGSKGQSGPEVEQFTSVIDGLKRLYEYKLKRMEQEYLFDQFFTPFLRPADFEAKPFILLLGQYSVGKTTFIQYLLDTEFKNSHIGPEPTTDRFMAVMEGSEFRVLPGNTVAVAADKPFSGLQRFGTDFLNKFEVTQLPAEVTFIDTPGVLSGEKQRIGRQYDFEEVCRWWASRSDRILLLFDAYKLDISDEFRRVIEALRGQEDKIRIVLNKADSVGNLANISDSGSLPDFKPDICQTGKLTTNHILALTTDPQQLMRVYGALMWSLGKCINSPEVARVYLGSFWNEDYRNATLAPLFDKEEQDLLSDLKTLPKMNAVRKVNELVKRCRLVRVHCLILSTLKGKDSKKAELIKTLPEVFKRVGLKYNLPQGDFPSVQRFQEKLENYDFSKFPKLNEKLLAQMEEVLAVDIPRLMQQFPDDTIGSTFN